MLLVTALVLSCSLRGYDVIPAATTSFLLLFSPSIISEAGLNKKHVVDDVTDRKIAYLDKNRFYIKPGQ